MSKKYSFVDSNFFEKGDSDKNIYYKVQEVKNLDKVESEYKPEGVLDPDVSMVEVKDVEKGS